MRIIVIAFKALPAALLSCYGGRTPTPACDAFAATGDLFTAYFSPSESADSLQRLKHSTAEIDYNDSLESLSTVISPHFEMRILLAECPLDPMIIDEFVGRVHEVIRTAIQEPCAIVLTASSGERITDPDNNWLATVRERAAHVPLIVRLPNQKSQRRRQHLMTISHLQELLRELTESADAYASWRDRAAESSLTYASDWAVATRTQDWLLIQRRRLDDSVPGGGSDGVDLDQNLSLFHKPEDVWETFDVASQYPQVIEHFLQSGELLPPHQLRGEG